MSIVTDTCAWQCNFHRPAIHCIVIVLLLLLHGCTSTPSPGTVFDRPVADTDSTISALGDESAPLNTLLANAQQYPTDALPAEMAIRILHSAINEQRYAIADKLIASWQADAASIDQYARFALLAIHYFNHSQQYQNAYQWLHSDTLQSRLPLMAASDQIALSLIRAQTLYGLQHYAASAMERIFIEDLLDDTQQQNSNREAIWQTLLKLPPDVLDQQQQRAINRSHQGWLELAAIYHHHQTDIDAQSAAVKQWQKRWPRHTAAKQLPGSVQILEHLAKSRPQSVGVLLPLSGPLDKAGKAVRDGISAAYFSAVQRGETVPLLRFYDTASQNIAELYQRASADDIELIIGPLHKDNVKALFTMPTELPILTLNFVHDGLPPPVNIVQFGLAAEDEAVQLAQHAQLQGYKNILLLQVDKDWARRAAAAFGRVWNRSPEHSMTLQILSLAENYSTEIARSLSLQQSEARLTRLQNVMGKRFEFSPRRRQDIDLVVLFANSAEAKAIKPLLAYHYAGKLPVYSSSQIYDGDTRADSNRDLNGIVFNEMPWVLSENALRQTLPSVYRHNKNLDRLFAMGADAYYLHPRLNQLAENPSSDILANTGRLKVENNRVTRQLQFAQFRAGKANIIKPQGTDN